MSRSRRCRVPLPIVVALGGLAGGARAQVAAVQGEVVVKVVEEVPFHEGTAALAALGYRVLEEAPTLRLALVAFDQRAHAPDAYAEVAVALEAQPFVAYAHPNFLGEGGYLPGDTHFGEQWHHRNTGQSGGTPGADVRTSEAWEVTRGSEDVVVAVLDSGIDSDHPEFAGRLHLGFDFVHQDSDPEDDHGHGTMVTAILAANADNGFGVAGVDHHCRITPVKVLDQFNLGTSFDLIQGLEYATAISADIVSMSLVNYEHTQGLVDALQAAREAGLILVACAGNGGLGNANFSWPGASPLTISVGSTNDHDLRAGFSATGTRLDVVAPGVDVITARYDSMADLTSSFSGCSAATPVVAGIAALLRGLDPNLGHFAISQHLKDNADDQVGAPGEDIPGWDEYYGWGRVNALATVSVCGPQRYCTPANPNQTGMPARLDYQGTTSVLENDLVFTVSPLADGNNGLIAYSPDEASLPLGNGVLCLGTQTLGFVLRLPGAAPVGGVLTHALDIQNPPIPGVGQITVGSTWNFQGWNRDFTPGGAGFNFSDALSITFCP